MNFFQICRVTIFESIIRVKAEMLIMNITAHAILKDEQANLSLDEITYII